MTWRRCVIEKSLQVLLGHPIIIITPVASLTPFHITDTLADKRLSCPWQTSYPSGEDVASIRLISAGHKNKQAILLVGFLLPSRLTIRKGLWYDYRNCVFPDQVSHHRRKA
jgi:hypothetical protein